MTKYIKCADCGSVTDAHRADLRVYNSVTGSISYLAHVCADRTRCDEVRMGTLKSQESPVIGEFTDFAMLSAVVGRALAATIEVKESMEIMGAISRSIMDKWGVRSKFEAAERKKIAPV